jgi:type IX secretion system PorP/SprF family membrane protein
MVKARKYITLILFCCSTALSFGQDEIVISNSRYLQKSNPSYFGYNSLTKVGVLYNSLSYNSFSNIDNKYLYGAISFERQKFSLGVDFNSLTIGNTATNFNKGGLSYVYQIQLGNELFLLPALKIGFGSQTTDPSRLVFGDQLNQVTGLINTESKDELASIITSTNYFNLGASFLIHNYDFMFGLSLSNLNRPNTSFNKESTYQAPILIAIQSAYEFNINPYERRFLPRYSYLMFFVNATKSQDSYNLYLSQELQLGEFSVGFIQQAGYVSGVNLSSVGLNLGLTFENFDFGVAYNFPFQNIGNYYTPSIFELNVTFDFSIFRRNFRGQYKRIHTDNYY